MTQNLRDPEPANAPDVLAELAKVLEYSAALTAELETIVCDSSVLGDQPDDGTLKSMQRLDLVRQLQDDISTSLNGLSARLDGNEISASSMQEIIAECKLELVRRALEGLDDFGDQKLPAASVVSSESTGEPDFF